jgi:hypothetical protein
MGQRADGFVHNNAEMIEKTQTLVTRIDECSGALKVDRQQGDVIFLSVPLRML